MRDRDGASVAELRVHARACPCARARTDAGAYTCIHMHIGAHTQTWTHAESQAMAARQREYRDGVDEARGDPWHAYTRHWARPIVTCEVLAPGRVLDQISNKYRVG